MDDPYPATISFLCIKRKFRTLRKCRTVSVLMISPCSIFLRQNTASKLNLFSGRFLNGSVLLLFHLSDLSNGLFNHNQTWIGSLSISVPMIISLGNFKFPEVSRLVLEILFYLPYFFTHAPKKNRRAQIKSAFSLDLTLERERARVKTGFGSIIMDVFICLFLFGN